MFELKSSPIFNLSMASKELFHSNMLYWISQTYPQQFLAILSQLGINTQDWPGSWKCYREKYNFDFSITNEEGCEFLFVLENKVKSIPYKEQLDKYKDKLKGSNTQWMLLSLVTEIPQYEIIKNNGWNIKNYQDLAFAIYWVLPSINNCYHRQLLEDYCNCILSLHKIQSSWNYKDNDSYLDLFVKDSQDIEDLRIEDVRKKVLYSRLAAKMQDVLGAKIHNNKEISKEKEQSKPGEIYVNSGMTHATGLVDIKIRITGNLLFVIQLQGDAYKHCMETLDVEGETVKTLKAVGQKLENNNSENTISNKISSIVDKYFYSMAEERDLSRYSFDNGKVELPQQKIKKGQQTIMPYNKYGSTFIYQYVKITDQTKVKDIIDVIKSEVEDVIKIVTNKQK